MTLHNLAMVIRMGMSVRMWQFLYRMQRSMRGDKNYKLSNLLRTSLNVIKGEKIVKHGKGFIITSFLPPLPSRAYESLALAVPEKENCFTQQMLAKRKAPISVFMEVTDRCDYSCQHCSIAKRQHGTQLSTEVWIDIIKQLQEMGTSIIGFTGGEPMLRPDIDALIGAVDDRSVTILYTNGSRLTYARALELKKAGLYAVGISLDADDAATHNKFRGVENAFELAVQAIGHASKAGLYTFAQRVVLPKDLQKEKLFAFFRFAKQAGADEVRILEPIPCGKLLTDTEDCFYTEANREYLKAVQYESNSRRDFPKITTFAHTESHSQFGCGAGTQHSYISSSGELFPCDFTPLSFGNAAREPLGALWMRMNACMGLPKNGCFAMTLAEKLKQEPGLELPLPQAASEQFCRENQHSEYPLFYRLMQGKK